MDGFAETLRLLEANAAAADHYESDRRDFLKKGAMAAVALGLWTPALAEAGTKGVTGREVSFYNAHTGDKFRGEYWYRGKYQPDAFREIKRVMRDYRTGERFPIDPRLIDILFVLNHRLRNGTPYEVFSGYRSPRTNAFLRRHTAGVARNSLHMQGQAVDLSLPGTSLGTLRKAAVQLGSGGVGFYPESSFVHIDTGRVRSW